MGTLRLAGQAKLLLDGRIAFAEFARVTRPDYERMASYLTRRWAPPGWFTDEDMVQELLLATWDRIWLYDATRGATLGAFLVYNIMSTAKTKLHKARGAKQSGTRDKNPSRMEVPLSAMVRRSDDPEGSIDDLISRFAAWERTAEDDALEAEALRARRRKLVYGACRTGLERRAVIAVFEAGDVDEAGAMLYDDPALRARLGVESREVMSGFVASLAADVVERAEGAS